ncbi:DMT family transporter [Brucella intermedia]|jgi:drug/metabolite transporter (DMT)-like permease|uniref:DMT family transporter n=2 Tax=Brucellaceae TaxID=118882 RepID=A0ABY5UDF0_9HYPH|nr:DMT family transporter [Brucella pseudintermedia]MCO7725097.1 DMT family transporter [Brucella intermedia]NKE76123.1 DMT family transporter [Ochrobactrum sp. MC-1LL]KAB2682724.1 DMT family transporter [Brucella pseudintermedia]UWL61361.1 DMT family transporter [Brucella pseudintermedia]WPM81403.1 DMT family transporter [Brucella pseudintermedia]
MVAACSAYAAVNVATQWAGTRTGIPSVIIAFWQYVIALVLTLPMIIRDGAGALLTSRLGLHVMRVALAAAGVQVWIYALTHVPIWQVVALSMTSPFFVILCARLFLREKVTPARLLTTFAGFVGALVIIAPWSDSYTVYSLLPVLAAALWAGYSVMTKYLTRFERPARISAYMLVLLTPINAALWLASGLSMTAIAAPSVEIWSILIVIGAFTALAQYFQIAAYSIADAVYLQPFDDLRLPINVIFGWIVFAAAPGINFWPGAALIVGASLYLMRQDSGTTRTA